MEIVVVDNASTDDTESVVRDLARTVRRLRHVLEPQLGVSHARNRGAAEANGELVAFIDDDAVASRGWLKALARAAHDEPNAVAVGGQEGLLWQTLNSRQLLDLVDRLAEELTGHVLEPERRGGDDLVLTVDVSAAHPTAGHVDDLEPGGEIDLGLTANCRKREHDDHEEYRTHGRILI